MYRPRLNYRKILISPTSADRCWAATAIGLGIWESIAVISRKIPTISRTVTMARKRHGRPTEGAVLLWLIGLGLHLLKRSTDQ
jgi:hypothetical protein